ncbi:unnamed protein product, partial [Amoebophrya sp. A120]
VNAHEPALSLATLCGDEDCDRQPPTPGLQEIVLYSPPGSATPTAVSLFKAKMNFATG